MKNTGPIVLVLGCDQPYFEGLWITLLTTLINTKHNQEFEIFILNGGITHESKDKLEHQIRTLNANTIIHWLDTNGEQFGNVQAMENMSVMCYARLLIPDLIPHSRAIWLDVDLIVNTNIRELWDIQLEKECAMAASLESSPALFIEDVSNLKDLGIPENAPYFNSGVLLLNNTKLREIEFPSRCIEFLETQIGNYKWHDQSAINVLLHGKIQKLPRKWNYLNTLTQSPKDELRVFMDSNHIYHFLQRPKPWQKYLCTLHGEMFYALAKASGLNLNRLNLPENKYEYYKWRYPRLMWAIYLLKNLFKRDQKLIVDMVKEVQEKRSEYRSIRNLHRPEILAVTKRLTDTYKRRVDDA